MPDAQRIGNGQSALFCRRCSRKASLVGQGAGVCNITGASNSARCAIPIRTARWMESSVRS
ncbi:hypothetical protein B0T16DRAFT_421583 [Cercophora newfieldiana]|uniref:Uncharacterized protein n=1 Tax=Cercophora newfieldiana TaxID=92897 RepID=A0AA40CHQ1_9PEZI|nr:hypothetical protein B0T16DRAFT_421583 [Cercophora newfieldiana]